MIIRTTITTVESRAWERLLSGHFFHYCMMNTHNSALMRSGKKKNSGGWRERERELGYTTEESRSLKIDQSEGEASLMPLCS